MRKHPLPIPRKSFRLDEIAARNSFSTGFIYKQVHLGLLRVRKAGSTTIVTAEDEAAWLEAMPSTLQEPAQLSASRAKRALRNGISAPREEKKDEHNS
jgi:hypothetical protein